MASAAGACARKRARPAAAAAAAAIAAASVQVGGKRKVDASPDTHAAKRGPGVAPSLAPTAAELAAAVAEAAAAAQALTTRVRSELKSDDNKADDPAELRRLIGELNARPIRDQYRLVALNPNATDGAVHVAMFAGNLVFPDACPPGSVARGQLTDSLCRSIHTHFGQDAFVVMTHALELSLLLRLLVALGGDINMPMYRVYPGGTAAGYYNVPIAAGKPNVPAPGGVHDTTTTTIAEHITQDHVALAVGMAGHRLRINWETFHVPPSGRPVITAGWALCTFACESTLCHSYGPTASVLGDGDVFERLVCVIGERGAFFCDSGTVSAFRMNFLRPWYRGSVAPFRQFERDDDSEFLFPSAISSSNEQLASDYAGWASAVNARRIARRKAYNAALAATAGEADCQVFLTLTKTLWPLVASFAAWAVA